MGSELEHVLAQTAGTAFEQLAFLMPEPEAPDTEAPAPESLRGMVVRFRGPTAGAVLVRADPVLLSLLAENLMGGDSAPDPVLQLDALGEVANVICGNLLPLVEDPVSEYRLGSPVPEEEVVTGPVRASVRLELEGGVVEVVLCGPHQ